MVFEPVKKDGLVSFNEDRGDREALIEYTLRWGECTTDLYTCNKEQVAAPDGIDCGGIFDPCIQNNKDNLFVRAPDGWCSGALISGYSDSTSAAQSEQCRNDMGNCASWYDAGCANPCFDAFNTGKARIPEQVERDSV